jgi:hypothetical protein
MRRTIASLSAALLISIPAAAQNKTAIDDLSHHPFATAFPSGGRLTLRIRSGDIHIVGSDEDKLAVRISGSKGSDSTEIRASFGRSGNSAELDVSGGPSNDVTITVEVPRHCHLTVSVPAGNVNVEGITGDKDIRLRAGDLTIAVGDPADYARVEASVTAGDISARPFNESHGGLFRSFEKTGAGKYTLVARLWAGDLTLK